MTIPREELRLNIFPTDDEYIEVICRYLGVFYISIEGSKNETHDDEALQMLLSVPDEADKKDEFAQGASLRVEPQNILT